ncbi:MAG: ATP synthase subunit I [Planctomycetota bacterium]|nr:MAG: ATP synthase subunit I [Planctomycetota bacterium]
MEFDPVQMSLAFGAGLGLGVFYFGLLWLTVRKIGSAARPASLIFLSFALRMGVVLTAFYFIVDGGWERLVACLLGFIIMRTLFLLRLKPNVEKA